MISGYVWICTVGNGVHVYNTSNINDPFASWGQDEKQQVFTLLYVEESSSILALARKGMYVFDSDLGSSDYTIVLEPRHSVLNEDEVFPIEGVVIPPVRNVKTTEIWVCSQTGRGFNILHPRSFHVVERISNYQSEDRTRKIRHLQPMVVNDLSYLAIGNRHVIERWDVENRLKIDEFDMMDYCKAFYGDQSKLIIQTAFCKVQHNYTVHVHCIIYYT